METEQEELEALQKWWKENGRAVVIGLVVIVAFARRARRAETTVVAAAPSQSPVVADLDPDLKAQMAEELDRFDE